MLNLGLAGSVIPTIAAVADSVTIASTNLFSVAVGTSAPIPSLSMSPTVVTVNTGNCQLQMTNTSATATLSCSTVCLASFLFVCIHFLIM